MIFHIRNPRSEIFLFAQYCLPYIDTFSRQEGKILHFSQHCHTLSDTLLTKRHTILSYLSNNKIRSNLIHPPPGRATPSRAHASPLPCRTPPPPHPQTHKSSEQLTSSLHQSVTRPTPSHPSPPSDTTPNPQPPTPSSPTPNLPSPKHGPQPTPHPAPHSALPLALPLANRPTHRQSRPATWRNGRRGCGG